MGFPVPRLTDATGFALHPEGRFEFIVQRTDTKVRDDGAESGLFFLDPADGDPNRPTLVVGFTLTENWLWKLRDFVEACGLDLEGGYDSDRLIGKHVVGYVIHTTSKGKTYANVNSWESCQGPAPQKKVGKDGLPF